MSAKIRFWSKLLLLLYLAGLVYVCFLSETFGRDIVSDGYRYNLQPFKEINRFYTYREVVGLSSIINLIGNVAAFVPFGFILPVIKTKRRTLIHITAATFLLSLTIEVSQLFLKVGSFDVDDLILNTAGGIIGFILFSIANGVRSAYGKRHI